MFDSLEDRMKAEDIEGTPKERLMRYLVIGALAAVVVAGIVLATEFLKIAHSYRNTLPFRNVQAQPEIVRVRSRRK